MGTELEQKPVVLKLADDGNVVLVKGAERMDLGPKDAVCDVLADFLAEVDYGEG